MMDEQLLIETVEKYLKGELTPQELYFFEELRKSNPTVDQFVVEQSFLFNELDKHAAARSFRHAVHEVENKLTEEGLVSRSQLKGKAKLSYMWKRYKRNIAVAASIAGFMSIITAGLILAYTRKVNESNKMDLIAVLNQVKTTDNKVDRILNSGTKTTITPPADYRATGFLVDGQGYLVTNAHVVNRLKTIYVENSRGEYYKAVSVYADNESDLALLKIIDTAFKVIPALPYNIRKTNLDLAEPIFTLGFPRNEMVYGEGYLSAKSGNDGDSTAYQLTISVNPGNSGGPVLNKNGEVIGIITSKDKTADGVVYAAKSLNIYKLLESVKKADENQNIKLPVNSGLKGLSRTQQVNKLEEFVFMVIGK